jgi:hypothetical protein
LNNLKRNSVKQTAEEFLRGKPFSIESIHSNMIQFAKLHVEAALKAASENADTIHIRNTNDYEIDKESILNAYPLTNIK